jgi:uncharacterized membrane protein YfcA
MDGLGLLPVATVSFLSGCTVLCMSGVSIAGRDKSVRIRDGVSGYLAIGASVGGVAGKMLFTALTAGLARQNLVGVIQTAILLIVNVGVLVYIYHKEKLTRPPASGAAICLLIGCLLGVISSFLGIGGGPLNIVMLAYFFGMRGKEAALNSLFIIFCSQMTSLLNTVFSGAVPPFAWQALLAMCAGGVIGAACGRRVSARIDDHKMDKLFKWTLLFLIALNIVNLVRFLAG